ncbi:hypothetical protein K502DRAFT_349231 [Neoconidiobolus thromboides FSU 785]|nr:hypothetical protein K502DRAFT_349231 [Neoconidiobolus thromboides FSU 785]
MSTTNTTVNAPKDKSEKTLYYSVIQNVCRLEDELIQMESKKLKDKLINCDEKIARLQKGTSSEYLKEIRKLSLLRENEFQRVQLSHKYRISLIEKVYQHEIESIEKDFTNEVQNIRSSLLLDIEDKLHKLKEDRENVDISNDYEAETYSRGHPTTRRNRRKGENEPAKSKRKYNNYILFLKKILLFVYKQSYYL